MIDFCKIKIDDQPETLIPKLINENWNVSGEYDLHTGEIKEYPITAVTETLEIKFHSPAFIELSGSLHKFAHAGFNYTDFNFTDLLKTIIALNDTIQLNPFTAILRSLEFGVNISPPFETKPFLRQVLSYGGARFTDMRSKGGRSLGIHCQLSQMRIKMYCKKSQYGLPKENMRFEIHVGKMQYPNKKGISIKILSDLLLIDNLHALGNLLVEVFKEIVIIDKSISIESLSAPERKIYQNWCNPIYTEELHRINIKKYQYERRRLKDIQCKYSKENKQQIIAQLIQEKINELLKTDSITSTIFTDFQNRFPKQNFNLFYRSYKGEIPPNSEPKQPQCKITGKDISDQRKGSKFMSAKRIGYREAHKLRNIDSNPRNNLRRSLNKLCMTPALFDSTQYLQLKDEQKESLRYWQGTKFEVKLVNCKIQ